MRFIHVYTMKQQPERIREVAPTHAAYWRGLALPGYLGGPFDDRSGGAITFEAESASAAERLVASDPFLREGLLESSTTHAWTVE